MCLQRPLKIPKKVASGGIGYKSVNSTMIEGAFTSIFYHKMYKLGRTYSDASNENIPAKGGEYLKGFHIYTSKEDCVLQGCNGEIVIQVKYSNVVAYGNDGGTLSKVVVAKKMKVVKVEGVIDSVQDNMTVKRVLKSLQPS